MIETNLGNAEYFYELSHVCPPLWTRISSPKLPVLC